MASIIRHDDLASNVGSAASGQRGPAQGSPPSLGVSRTLCATADRPLHVGDWSQVRSQQIGADFAGNTTPSSGHSTATAITHPPSNALSIPNKQGSADGSTRL